MTGSDTEYGPSRYDFVADHVAQYEATGGGDGRLWEVATGTYPDYDDYQADCERQIPVVVLESR